MPEFDPLIVFLTKFPAPGRVKTRLCPPCSPAEASNIHKLFLLHCFHRTGAVATRPPYICHDPPDSADAFAKLLSITAYDRLIPQSAGDLSVRLAKAHQLLISHSQPILFLGTDSPDLPRTHLQLALQLLQHVDVLLGPTLDGGYWCLGLSTHVDVTLLLKNIEWSTGREFQQTLDAAKLLQYSHALAPEWHDVDRPEDLNRLMSRLKASTDPEDGRLLKELTAILTEFTDV